MTMIKKYKLKIQSHLDLVSDAVNCILDFCQEMGMDEMDCYQVKTSLTEGINNAIIHAYDNHTDQKVNLIWWNDNGYLKIEISDQGKVMRKQPPDIEPALDADSGRGWWIMRRWMDSIDYHSQNGHNTLILTKKLNR